MITQWGSKHTLALDRHGNLWYWGSKSSVGIEDIEHEHQKVPAVLLSADEVEPIVNISVRHDQNLAVTATGRIIGFGEEEKEAELSENDSDDEMYKG